MALWGEPLDPNGAVLVGERCWCPRPRLLLNRFKSAWSLCGADGDEKVHWLRFGRTGPN